MELKQRWKRVYLYPWAAQSCLQSAVCVYFCADARRVTLFLLTCDRRGLNRHPLWIEPSVCVSWAPFKEVPQGPDTPGSRRTFSWWPCRWCPPYTGQNQWSSCDRPYPTSGFPARTTHMNGFEADKGKDESADLRRCLPSGHGKQSSLSASNPTQKRSQRRRNGFCPPKIHALSTNEKTAAII